MGARDRPDRGARGVSTTEHDPAVDAVIAVHDVSRRVDRGVTSVLDNEVPVRVTVVCHGLETEHVGEALGGVADDPRVRLFAFSDGVRSPAGPFTAGLRAASAEFVAIMGSDDFLEPSALDRWVEHARRHETDFLIAPRRMQSGARSRDPLVRPGHVNGLDPVLDRLDYCTAPLGLLRRESFERVGIPLTPGLASGEDLELGLALVRTGRVDYDARLPAYVIGEDARVRVTFEERSAADELEALARLLERPWVAELPDRERTALVRRLWRMNLVPAVARRPRPEQWTDADAEVVKGAAKRLEVLAPDATAALARSERTIVDAVSGEVSVPGLVRAVAGNAASGRLARALTESPRHAVDRDAPLRRAGRLAVPDGLRPPDPADALRRAVAAARRGPGRALAGLVGSRTALPRPVNAAIDWVADHPGSIPGRVAALQYGKVRPGAVPSPSSVPPQRTRLYIGPVNYSEQAYAWARAVEAARPDIGARNASIAVPEGFAFRTDAEVPVAVYHRSKEWQRAELAVVQRFTHVLVEAQWPLFGRLFMRDLEAEARALGRAGVSLAYMCHGTDIRLPSRHVEATPWSPYGDAGLYTARHEAEARRNAELLRRLDRPTFVSTPDLLADVPFATWCPVVVDVGRWSAGADTRAPREVPVVAHVPSRSAIKGSDLVRPPMQALAGDGLIDYREVTGVPSAQMPSVWGEADIVLDQFRLGSYGVGACEAMAAGAVVVGHVVDAVRRNVREATGLELPIVEADPDTVGGVVRALAENPARRASLAVQGAAFVRSVHDGRRSAQVLIDRWIDRSTGTDVPE